jgi:flagellar hook-associated protein 3 FlgL
MRVTENTNYDTIRGSIHKSRERMETLQGQQATLKKLNTPSDDPIGAAKVLEIRTEKVNNDQFQSNAKMAETFLSNTDQALGELTDILMRAKEIAINQSSGASSNEDTRLGVAEEVTQLFQQAVSTANRRIADRFLFGGYKTGNNPIDGDGRYKGDDGQMMVEVAKDVFISMNVTGLDAFNSNPKRATSDKPGSYDGKDGTVVNRSIAGEAYARSSTESTLDKAASEASGPENVNAFDEIQNLRIGLLTGDLDGIRTTLERLDQIQGKVVATRAKVGSRLQGLQNTSSAIERHNLVNAQLSSNIEDADMAQVVSELAKEETVFRSALASSHKLIQPTLLDFLK